MHERIANWSNEDNVYAWRTPKWYKQAACRGKSSDLFFEESVRSLVLEGKSYCFRCPVRVECLEFAIARDEIGVWGGMTTAERRRERRRRILSQRHGASKQTQRHPRRTARREVAAEVRVEQRGAEPSRVDG
jgi:WhiB family redox-sensing transcriptional regulator